MRTPDLNDAVNDLMDLEFAGERRCRVSAELVKAPPLQAQLLLRAAEHLADAERLRSLVIEMRGTPHSGETTATLADPVHYVPRVDGGGDRELLEACIAEQDADVAQCDKLLQTEGVPERVKSVVGQCREAAVARQRGLGDMRVQLQMG